MTIAYASLKAKGFRILPLSGNKTHKYATLALWGALGYIVGAGVVATSVGDKLSSEYLVKNKSEILSGEKAM
jgi:hypothetical protein